MIFLPADLIEKLWEESDNDSTILDIDDLVRENMEAFYIVTAV